MTKTNDDAFWDAYNNELARQAPIQSLLDLDRLAELNPQNEWAMRERLAWKLGRYPCVPVPVVKNEDKSD